MQVSHYCCQKKQNVSSIISLIICEEVCLCLQLRIHNNYYQVLLCEPCESLFLNASIVT